MTMNGLPATLKVLSDPTRLRILALLAQEELSVGELVRALAMSQSRISNHLKVLREAGMLDERREGAFVHVRIATGDGLPRQRLGSQERVGVLVAARRKGFLGGLQIGGREGPTGFCSADECQQEPAEHAQASRVHPLRAA